MITLGLDPHPGSHTVVALDSNGSLLANLTVPNTVAGLGQLHLFAGQFGARRWAIEGAGNHFIAKFVTELLAQEETVYSIAPSLTSQCRSRRGRKKNDIVDAANVARALLANPQLPALRSREQQRELQEISRAQHRLSEQLKSNRSALAELTGYSPVREILEQVIQTLVVQLKELEKQLLSSSESAMAKRTRTSRSRRLCGRGLGRSRRSRRLASKTRRLQVDPLVPPLRTRLIRTKKVRRFRVSSTP